MNPQTDKFTGIREYTPVDQEEGFYTEGPNWAWGLMIFASVLWGLFIFWALHQ